MTDNEMQRMQQEAVRRTREMQRRAASYRTPIPRDPPPESTPATTAAAASAAAHADAEDDPSPPPSEPPKDIPPTDTDSSTPIHEPPVAGHAADRTAGGILETLFQDKEKTLIMGILLLLLDEKTDNSLLLALMYLLV